MTKSTKDKMTKYFSRSIIILYKNFTDTYMYSRHICTTSDFAYVTYGKNKHNSQNPFYKILKLVFIVNKSIFWYY